MSSILPPTWTMSGNTSADPTTPLLHDILIELSGANSAQVLGVVFAGVTVITGLIVYKEAIKRGWLYLKLRWQRGKSMRSIILTGYTI